MFLNARNLAVRGGIVTADTVTFTTASTFSSTTENTRVMNFPSGLQANDIGVLFLWINRGDNSTLRTTHADFDITGWEKIYSVGSTPSPDYYSTRVMSFATVLEAANTSSSITINNESLSAFWGGIYWFRPNAKINGVVPSSFTYTLTTNPTDPAAQTINYTNASKPAIGFQVYQKLSATNTATSTLSMDATNYLPYQNGSTANQWHRVDYKIFNSTSTLVNSTIDMDAAHPGYSGGLPEGYTMKMLLGGFYLNIV